MAFLPIGDCVGLDTTEWKATNLTNAQSLNKQRWANSTERLNSSSMTGKLHDKTGNRELCALYGKPNIRRRPRLHELQTDSIQGLLRSHNTLPADRLWF